LDAFRTSSLSTTSYGGTCSTLANLLSGRIAAKGFAIILGDLLAFLIVTMEERKEMSLSSAGKSTYPDIPAFPCRSKTGIIITYFRNIIYNIAFFPPKNNNMMLKGRDSNRFPKTGVFSILGPFY